MSTPINSVTTVIGHWRRASSSADLDLEAHPITGSYAPFTLPSAPPPAVAASAPIRTPHTTRPSIVTTTDPIDDFFGVTHTCARATRESRHDGRVSRFLTGRVSASTVPPPPYVDGPDLPAYSAASSTQPITLAQYFFKFGFLFPPFWILGAIILLSPLTAPEDFEPSKSEGDRQQMVQIMREAEVRWAKRCVWAVVGLLGVAGVATAIALAVVYSRS